MRLLFLFKRGDKHANDMQKFVKKKYCLADILYYNEWKYNNEAKLRIYAYKLRMEFNLEVLQCFAVPEDNVLGVFAGAKSTMAAKVCLPSTQGKPHLS